MEMEMEMKMDINKSGDFSIMCNKMTDFYKKIKSDFDAMLSKKIREKLATLGYTFNSLDDFFCFCKYRINRIAINKNCYEFYLDYKTAENKGIFLVSYEDNVEYDFTTNKISFKTKISLNSCLL